MERNDLILRLRYEDKKTFREIGDLIGVTQERVRQIIGKLAPARIGESVSRQERICKICSKKYIVTKSELKGFRVDICSSDCRRSVCSICMVNPRAKYGHLCIGCNTQRSRDYRKTLVGKENWQKIQIRQVERHPEKVKARGILNGAIQKGKLVKPENCQGCGKVSRLDGHHNDYSKPLNVIWLCRDCHTGLHKRIEKKVVISV